MEHAVLVTFFSIFAQVMVYSLLGLLVFHLRLSNLIKARFGSCGTPETHPSISLTTKIRLQHKFSLNVWVYHRLRPLEKSYFHPTSCNCQCRQMFQFLLSYARDLTFIFSSLFPYCSFTCHIDHLRLRVTGRQVALGLRKVQMQSLIDLILLVTPSEMHQRQIFVLFCFFLFCLKTTISNCHSSKQACKLFRSFLLWHQIRVHL